MWMQSPGHLHPPKWQDPGCSPAVPSLQLSPFPSCTLLLGYPTATPSPGPGLGLSGMDLDLRCLMGIIWLLTNCRFQGSAGRECNSPRQDQVPPHCFTAGAVFATGLRVSWQGLGLAHQPGAGPGSCPSFLPSSRAGTGPWSLADWPVYGENPARA